MDLPDNAFLYMPLFWNKHLGPRHEAARVGRVAHVLLDSEDANAEAENACLMFDHGHYQLAKSVRAGEVPVCVLELVIGLTCLLVPRWDETVTLASDCAWSLAAPTGRPTSVASGLGRSDHATYPPVSDPWGRFEDRPTDRDDRTESPIELLEFVDRTAWLGLGGRSFDALPRSRQVACHNRHVSVAWEALADTMDAFAGSILALERLSRLAPRLVDTPALLWLAESAHRIAGDRALANDCATRVDRLLGGGPYGRSALSYADLAARREAFEEDSTSVADAILRLGAHPRTRRPSRREHVGPILPERLEQWRAAARLGSQFAATMLAIDQFIDDEEVEVAWERESEGPFHGLFPEDSLKAMLGPTLDEVFTAFRVIAGLERIASSLESVDAWCARTQE